MIQRPLKLAVICFGASFLLALVFGRTGVFGTTGLSVTNLLRLIGWLSVSVWGVRDSRELWRGTGWSRVQMVLAAIGYAVLALVLTYIVGAIPDYLHGA